MFPHSKKKNSWPSKQQWAQFFKVLTKKEKIAFSIFFLLAFSSFTFVLLNFYFTNTEIMPAQGGIYTEGIIGQPRFINPVYANSDLDRDLVELIFSGLMKYNENLQIIPDLAQDYPEIEEQGKVYKFFLKENISWQDGTPLTADDVIFTIKTIQSPDYKSPLRANWVGVEVEKISEFGIKFKLKKPYSAFLENCVVKIIPKHIWENVSPENFPLETYNLKPVGSGLYKIKKTTQDRSDKINSLTLVTNSGYFGKKPNISEIKFLFFNDEKELIKAALHEKIKGLSLTDPNFAEQNLNGLKENWQRYYLSLPRYFAVFFNSDKSKILSEKEVRLALNYATNKKEIVKEILNLPENSPIIEKEVIHSPILPEIYGFSPPSNIYEYNVEKAKDLLEKAGFKENQDACPPSAVAEGDCRQGLRERIIKKEPVFEFKTRLTKDSQGKEVEELQKCLAKFPEIYPQGEITGWFGPKTKQAVIIFQEKYAQEILDPWGFKNGTGLVGETTRVKLNEVCFEAPEETLPLKFSLVTVDQPQLLEVAEFLKQQWRIVGVEVNIEKFSISQLEQDFIKPRNYESLLFGEVLGALPDPFPFWHSSQKRDPGLNLAVYENKKVDKLLEEIRESSNSDEKNEKLALFQDILIEDAPVVFLYSSDYIYLVSKEVKGIEVKKIADPSKRFSGIENWYIKTRRVWK